MRLIDADKLRKILEDKESPCELQKALLGIIDAQPTTYDVDTVVKQLEQQAEQYHNRAEKYAAAGVTLEAKHMAGKVASYEHAIDIVKAGGVDSCVRCKQ